MNEQQTTFLGELAAMDAAADTERMANTDAQFVPVDFHRLIIHACPYSMRTWRERGYRQFRDCQPVRTDYIHNFPDLFAVFADERPGWAR